MLKIVSNLYLITILTYDLYINFPFLMFRSMYSVSINLSIMPFNSAIVKVHVVTLGKILL